MKGIHLIKRLGQPALILVATLATTSALTRAAYAHATYNISGYDSGLAGSTNGADGSPTTVPPATWTNGGIAEYTGTLPVQWYAGMHNNHTSRTIQTGVTPSPATGSLLQQTNSYNTANDPDYPTDRVIAVGGKSWSDPANSGQGWGHGLDYGLIHFTPLPTILVNGPVSATITLADDPTDPPVMQLAFALYKGWDTSAIADRHQTFYTSPSPLASNPLDSTGLQLVDYAVATTPGQTLTRTYTLSALTGGADEEFTIFIGALGGVAGQYQLTVTTFLDTDEDGIPDVSDNRPNTYNHDQTDTDGDGIGDACDNCPITSNLDQADTNSNGIGDACEGQIVGQLRQSIADLATANASLAQCTTNLATGDANLAQCTTDLASANGAVTSANAALVTANANLAQCTTNLTSANAALAAATTDADGDGIPDAYDTCPSTPAGTAVDQEGCSLAQFCGKFPTTTRAQRSACNNADWKNDEPVFPKLSDHDCKYVRASRHDPYMCVPRL